ncbi:acetyl/propionyl/methylcrotonyl-CoA carboxylase subunit alpha [Aliikangiella sp. IMCC44359]|uniref:acetyl/propionyl/methylcrotonyl-CoA carboxylase subunit alpha n=1 Tax=Aliikangiella sp. IMCC44359 TaxID=3459125 RepID=UPI00403B0988
MINIKINKILIANRGEIACRIIRTAQRMGIECVAVYSDADKNAQHVKLADEALHIGASTAKESYLNADLILKIAQKTQSDAIHPGYGFLSENAEFAKKCAAANIIFIGPPVAAIEAMGSKSEAKEIMTQASVPLVEGYHGDNQDENFLRQKAEEIGFPVLIKATAGGGGKGMRVVETSEQFIDSLHSCQREALSSFGDNKVLVEKYLTKPRHIEIQVFADNNGNTIHLFERDCSVQRRHQKVIEEAPAPGLSEQKREEMGAVAVTAAKAIGYQGAGTVEFLYDEDGSFYFMEMNTRLQVEHPVTEMITGLDLVEWQITVANGLPLPLKQSELSINGHAFEARIYAEDPNNDFLPATGKISYIGLPHCNTNVRVDSGVTSGDSISVFYDPMIAKLIVWDRDRSAALARLRGALADLHVAGISTNIEFLHQLASNDSFNNADLDTHFLEKHEEELLALGKEVEVDILAAAALQIMLKQSSQSSQNKADANSPWEQTDGWRLNEDNYHLIQVSHGNNNYSITAHFRDSGFLLEIEQKEYVASGYIDANKLYLDLDGHKTVVSFIEENNQLVVFKNANSWELKIIDNSLFNIEADTQANLTAPMPGTVIDVLVNAGDQVEEGQALIVMEAMKMEHTIKAHKNATIADVLYQEGDLVDDGAELIIFDDE